MTIFIVAHSRICFRIVLNFYKKSNIYEVLNAVPFFCYQFLVYPFWLFNHCHFGISVKTLKSCPPSQISWLFFRFCKLFWWTWILWSYLWTPRWTSQKHIWKCLFCLYILLFCLLYLLMTCNPTIFFLVFSFSFLFR
jgi:hypothetical protein